MRSLKTKRGALVFVLLGLIIIILVILFIRNDQESDKTVSKSATESFQENIAEEIKLKGDSASHEAFLVQARKYLEDIKLEDARSMLNKIDDDKAKDEVLVEKYNILMSSYIIQSDRTMLSKTIDKFKKLASDRNSGYMIENTLYLNDAYIDRVFTAPKNEEETDR